MDARLFRAKFSLSEYPSGGKKKSVTEIFKEKDA